MPVNLRLSHNSVDRRTLHIAKALALDVAAAVGLSYVAETYRAEEGPTLPAREL